MSACDMWSERFMCMWFRCCSKEYFKSVLITECVYETWYLYAI